MEDNKYKLLSQANLYFKNGNIIDTCILYRQLISSYAKEDNIFYSMIISSLIENFIIATNQERYLINNIPLNKSESKVNFELKHDTSVKLSKLIEYSDYITRMNTLNMIMTYFTKETIDSKILITIGNCLLKEDLLQCEVDILSKIIQEFSPIFDQFIV